MTTLAFAILLAASLVAYALNRRAATGLRDGGQRLHSVSGYHGLFALLLILVPVLVVILVWLASQGAVVSALTMASLPDGTVDGLGQGQVDLILAEIQSISGGRVFGTPEPWKLEAAERLSNLRQTAALGLVLLTAVLCLGIMFFARAKVSAEFRARQGVERIVSGLMIFCSVVAIFTTIGIVASLAFETIKFLRLVPLSEFLFGLNWEPQIPIRADQIAAEGAFGWIPVIVGTLVITFVAIVIAVPVGLLSAIYLNEFAPKVVRSMAKPILEILAGVPTVVYGFFAILVVAPAIRSFGQSMGIPVSPNTAIAAGGVMGIMLVPFISSFADDALSAVPRSMRDGALALGATRAETVLNVLFPAAIPGIVGGVLLAVSRAIGETMIVVMAAGLIANLTLNPLESVTTVTVQIVTLLIGDTSFDNPKTLAAFALGMMLFIVTLIINIFAIRIVRKYREAYD
ncbi:phosphate ABC transporter permease subunit PstC [Puniceibacterium sp. IMCC21224]|uniref:phosphate ABC transporter permease subunit PstC n=1 Tax=Puniceibacterium sp. IMCC21224 TaxID=1618204 RepID=UPI00064DF453|nr:phosphate ABC transporter permease subunit PstC [Puniceibacterium sp. IMCC21224]KMK65381.1 phosphate ABC transporter membrane protein 1, PhoT family [Puniceibacterium sp. IMCC21224]